MTKENEELLPVGSVVYLKGGTLKLVILARGQMVKEKENDEKPVYYDYLGGLSPQGFDVKDNYYFNHKDIEQILFMGYRDEEEKRYSRVLMEWKDNNRLLLKGMTDE